MLDIRRQFFYREFDPLTGAIIDYQNRVQDDGGTYINECLRTRLNTELPLSDRLSILTPNGYKVGKLYSFKGTDYDFVRASNAYRFNSLGDMIIVANNEPRINFFQNECPQIVIEPQLTNSWTNNQLTSSYLIDNSARSLGTPIPNYFANGISAVPINDNVAGQSSTFNTTMYMYDARLKNRTFSMLISNPLSNFFSCIVGGLRCIFNLSNLESITDSNNTTGVVKKVKDNVWFVSVCVKNNTGSQFDQIRTCFVDSLSINLQTVITGTWLCGVPSIFFETRAISNDFTAGYIPFPQTTASTKLADVATVTPEIGTSEIIVNNNAPITTIPTTFTIPNGFIDKIVMK